MGVFDREKVAKYLAEFTGTMFLVMFVKLASTNDSYSAGCAGLSIGLGLALLIYAFGYISGAHLNPNVSIAILCQRLPSFSEPGMVAMYIVSQINGAVFGGFLSAIIGGKKAAAVYPSVYSGDFEQTKMLRAFVGETFFTFLLCSTVLHVAVDQRQQPNHYYGLAIGSSLALSIAAIGPLSGCCLNTAVWVGTVVPALVTDQIEGALSDAWVYWVATTLGGLIAGLWFNVIHGADAVTAKSNESGKTVDSAKSIKSR